MAKKKTYADAMADVTAAIEKYRKKMRSVEDDFVTESDYQRRISKLTRVQNELAKEQERQKMQEQMAQMQQMQQMQGQGQMPGQGMPPGMPQGPAQGMPQMTPPEMMPPQANPMMGYGGYLPKMQDAGYTPEQIEGLVPDPSNFSQFAQFIPDINTFATIHKMQAPPEMSMPEYRNTQTDMSMVYNPAQAGLREDLAAGKRGVESQFSNPQMTAAALSRMYGEGAGNRAQLTADQLTKEFELRDAASREASDTRRERQNVDFANRTNQYQFDVNKANAKATFGQDLGTKFSNLQQDKYERDLARTGLSIQSQAYDQGMFQRFLQALQDGTLTPEDD